MILRVKGLNTMEVNVISYSTADQRCTFTPPLTFTSAAAGQNILRTERTRAERGRGTARGRGTGRRDREEEKTDANSFSFSLHYISPGQ